MHPFSKSRNCCILCPINEGLVPICRFNHFIVLLSYNSLWNFAIRGVNPRRNRLTLHLSVVNSICHFSAYFTNIFRSPCSLWRPSILLTTQIKLSVLCELTDHVLYIHIKLYTYIINSKGPSNGPWRIPLVTSSNHKTNLVPSTLSTCKSNINSKVMNMYSVMSNILEQSPLWDLVNDLTEVHMYCNALVNTCYLLNKIKLKLNRLVRLDLPSTKPSWQFLNSFCLSKWSLIQDVIKF